MCKKIPRPNSIYCSDKCVWKHAQSTSAGRDFSAAVEGSLVPHQPKMPKNNRLDAKITPKASASESIRISIRNLLKEQLILRTSEITAPGAPTLTKDEITKFAGETELEIYAMFNSENSKKYRAKYRSLIFNIKDRKNDSLFQKISSKMIVPKQLVRMSAEELASQELAKWRENETKYELEIIRKAELDLLACAKNYVVKTHKGEIVMEDKDSDRIILDPSTPLKDVVSELNKSVLSKMVEPLASHQIAANPKIFEKDNRYDKHKHLCVKSTGSVTSSSSKRSKRKDSHRSRIRCRHDSKKSSRHRRNRSRERDQDDHKEQSGYDNDKHRKGQSRDKNQWEGRSDRDKKHDKDHKKGENEEGHDRNSRTEKRTSKGTFTKVKRVTIKNEDNHKLIDKIRKAQATIDSILGSKSKPKSECDTELDIGTPKRNVPLKMKSFSWIERLNEELTGTVIPTTLEASPTELIPAIWTGNLAMAYITCKTYAVPISGKSLQIEREFPKGLDIVGRIVPDTVWDYLGMVRRSKEILILRFLPQSNDDDIAYQALFTSLVSRKRIGVIQSCSSVIKNFYILPLAAHNSPPSVLLPLIGSGFESYRSDLLLGIIVKTCAALDLNSIAP